MSCDDPKSIAGLNIGLLNMQDAAIRSLELETELLRARNKQLAAQVEQLERQVAAEKEKHEYFVSLYEPQHRQALEERDEARRQVAELSKPVTDEEITQGCNKTYPHIGEWNPERTAFYAGVGWLKRLIAARVAFRKGGSGV